MLNLINSIQLKIVGPRNERTARASKNVLVSFVSTMVTLIISFIMVPMTLGFVGKVEYGIWLTISSIIAWFSYFDVGLGNGLRNKLAVALAEDDKEAAKIYISSCYALIGVISLVMFVGFFIMANFVSWNSILNTEIIPNSKLSKIVLTVFFFFCLGFAMKIISSILQAMQLYAINDIIGIITQLLGLFSVFILINFTNGNSNDSLFYLCLIYGSQSAIVLFFASLYLFSTKLKYFKPKLKSVNIKKSLPLLNLGGKFFMNQILYMIATQSSLFIVVQLFGPGEVTEFNLAKRYMALVSMVYMIVITPFLSAFTEAYTKQDFKWINKTMKTINLVWLLVVVASIGLILGYKIFFNIWVGGEVMPSWNLIIVLGVLGIGETYTATYSLFLNSIGKIRLQFFTLLISALLFIPLVLMLNSLGFGLISLVLPSILFAFVNSVIFKIQYNKIMNKKALGVWNK
jgi:O-antigen/teichoic acid export membrane protein